MDLEKSLKSKIQKRKESIKICAVEDFDESTTDNQLDRELNNIGSTVKLFQDKRKSFNKFDTKFVSQKSESTIMYVKPKELVKSTQSPKEFNITQVIKKKFAFFKKSANIKSMNDVEATIVENNKSKKSKRGQTVDIVVDVHLQNEEQKKQTIKKKTCSKFVNEIQQSNDVESTSSSNDLTMQSLDLVERVDKGKNINKKDLKTNFFSKKSESLLDNEDDISLSVTRDNNKLIDELTSEVVPNSEKKYSHHRKRWKKSEISADNLVENLKKTHRRQWIKDLVNTEVHKDLENKVPVTKKFTPDNLGILAKPKSMIITSTPIPAARTKKKQKKDYQAFDNDGYLFDHDEILRIETINDPNPQIKIDSSKIDIFEKESSFLSISDNKSSSTRPKLQKLKEYVPKIIEKTKYSNVKEQSSTDSSKCSDSFEIKNILRRGSNYKKKSLIDEKLNNDTNEKDENDEHEDKENVLNMMGKNLLQSSSSSKIDIIPSNFFNQKSTDNTTVSSSENINISSRISHHSRPTLKSKLSKKITDELENISERNSQIKSKTNSSSMQHSTEEFSNNKKKTKLRTKKQKTRKKREDFENIEKDIKYVSVWIHRSDLLEVDYITRHPMVKVHIVNIITGEYLMTRYKEKNDTVIQPIITQKFDFIEKKSMIPIWEEKLIFELNFKYILKEGTDSVLILFEIVDLHFSEASTSKDRFGKDTGWYKVAWAFLKPVGSSGVHHVNKKLRLQLYKPKNSFRKSRENICEVYKWWKSKKKDKYPSSLYVTLNAVDHPKLEPIVYDQILPLENVTNIHDSPFQELPTRLKVSERPKWTRFVGQSCAIPNETHVEVEAAESGCFHLTFSNNGNYLACALSEESDYPILVYKVQDGKIHVKFSGHKSFIYSLSWSKDDRFLLSVSSDRTARFWDVREKIIEYIQSLPHPSYVYCGKFSLELSNYIVTGCYDRIARIWALVIKNGTEKYELIQELEVHESFVNTVCFQPKNEIFFTGDGVGVIVAWSSKKSSRSPIRKEWQIMRKIKIKELEGVPINTIIIHPLGTRILVHSRNNGLRLMDLTRGSIIKTFDGLSNTRIQISACISACGTLLFCGGEDSTLNVWILETAKQVAIYKVAGHNRAVTCVDYHPNNHILAFAIFGTPVPVKILKFNCNADGKNVGLKFLTMRSSITSENSLKKLRKKPIIIKNRGRNLQILSTRSDKSLINVTQYGSFNHFSIENKHNHEVRVHVKSKVDTFIGNDTNLKNKNINSLNGIIEKIDRILAYATTQKSSNIDLESGQNSSIFTITTKEPQIKKKAMQLNDLDVKERIKRNHLYRTRSEGNSSSSLHKETEFSKALSDSAAFINKISRFSEDSWNSNRFMNDKKIIVDRLELEEIHHIDTESGIKDSLETIVDPKEEFTSEEILDIESLKSDDTYTVENVKKLAINEDRYLSEESNATFVVESQIPIPKPRKRITRINVI